MVRAPALAGGQQLHSEQHGEPVRDVATAVFRRGPRRYGIQVGRRPGDEYDAGLPPRPAMEERFGWSEAAHGQAVETGRRTQDAGDLRVVLFDSKSVWGFIFPPWHSSG